MSKRITRRDLIVKAGKTLAGVTLLASPLGAQYVTVGQKLIDGSAGSGAKPLFLAPRDSTDPAVHSLAENLFWNDILMEHASLIMAAMMAPELADQRSQADQFRRSFLAQVDRARAVALDRSNYPALNRSTIELIKPFIGFKQALLAAQSAGKLHTMIWPSFYEHMIHEAEQASARLMRLSSGDVAVKGADVVDFWCGIMSDHGQFIAHLLDPKETDLVTTALDSSAQFDGFHKSSQSKALRQADVFGATEELIDFQTAIETGVKVGTIRSTISPMLADHVRREALKFVDELKRAGFRT